MHQNFLKIYHMDPQELKSKVRIEEVISFYLPPDGWKGQGRSWRCRCPFDGHEDKNPSFSVHIEKQYFNCFGCNKGRDVYDFVIKKEGLSFPEAKLKVAQICGIDSSILEQSQVKNNAVKQTVNSRSKPGQVGEEVKQKKEGAERSKLYDILDRSSKYYQRRLSSKEGHKALEYLTDRGFKDEILKTFEIGVSSSDKWSDLYDQAQMHGYNSKELLSAGLVSHSKKGNFIDFFRSRITFPIHDLNGRTVGFGGRVYKEEEGSDIKYLNSKTTDLYEKSSLFFGLKQALEEMKKTKKSIPG